MTNILKLASKKRTTVYIVLASDNCPLIKNDIIYNV